MPLRETIEVIHGERVVRYNGNNPARGRQTVSKGRPEGLRQAPAWVQTRAASAAARRLWESSPERAELLRWSEVLRGEAAK